MAQRQGGNVNIVRIGIHRTVHSSWNKISEGTCSALLVRDIGWRGTSVDRLIVEEFLDRE